MDPKKPKAAKTSFIAALALFFSTSIALGQEAVPIAQPHPIPGENVTVVPKQPAPSVQSWRSAVASNDKRNIEDTIETQLTALASGNAEQAFANLTPAIQRYFSNPRDFLSMVQQEAAPITKTRSYSFVGIQFAGHGALQQVLLTDDSGRSWLAKFNLERQPAGDWRVKSCVVELMRGQQA